MVPISLSSQGFVILSLTSFWFVVILFCWSYRWCCLSCNSLCWLLVIENLLIHGLAWNSVAALDFSFWSIYFCFFVITGYLLLPAFMSVIVSVFKGTFWSMFSLSLILTLACAFAISSSIPNDWVCSSVDSFDDLELDDLDDDLELVDLEHDDFDFFSLFFASHLLLLISYGLCA